MSEHAREKNALQDRQLKDETPKEVFLNLSDCIQAAKLQLMLTVS